MGAVWPVSGMLGTNAAVMAAGGLPNMLLPPLPEHLQDGVQKLFIKQISPSAPGVCWLQFSYAEKA